MTPAMRLVTAVVLAAAASLLTMTPAGAQIDDQNCGDPGVGTNFPVEPGDPNAFDADHDGIGCEEDNGTPMPATGSEAGGDDLQELPRTGSDTNLIIAMAGGCILCLGVAAFVGAKVMRRPAASGH